MDAIEVASGNPKIAADGGADSQHDRVIALPELRAGDLDPDLDSAMEVSALIQHLPNAAIQNRLLHLELGNAIAQQPARRVRPFEDCNRVPGTSQLLSGCQP